VKSLIAAMLLCLSASATVINAASCSTANVQTAINTAVGADTVTIPSGTCTWTSGVTVSGKGITITGAGSGRIIAISEGAQTVGTGTKTITITNYSPGFSAVSITNGETLRISQTNARANWMEGTVTSLIAGVLTMNITSTGGSATALHRWLISTVPSTVIVNNSTSAILFTITEDTTNHTYVSGIKVAEGTGTQFIYAFVGAGSGKAIVLHDCWVEQNGVTGTVAHFDVNRGLIYNCSFDSSPFSMGPVVIQNQADGITNSWTTAATWGMLDTTGEGNIYIESSDFHAYLNATDNDNNGRMVFRYNLMNNAGFGTHGADTSFWGQRFFEYYNNVGVFNNYTDLTTFNMNWWMFVRGGSFVVHDNTLPALVSTDYGTKADIDMIVMNLQREAGDNPCWGAGTSGGAQYHAPRQVGFGRVTGAGTDGLGRTVDDYTYVGDIEPAYIWANSRQPLTNVVVADYGPGNTNSCTGSTYDTSLNYIIENREFFNGGTAKPGYTPYTYPHPLEGAPPPPLTPAPARGMFAMLMEIN
jgi:hypothetical protein